MGCLCGDAEPQGARHQPQFLCSLSHDSGGAPILQRHEPDPTVAPLDPHRRWHPPPSTSSSALLDVSHGDGFLHSVAPRTPLPPTATPPSPTEDIVFFPNQRWRPSLPTQDGVVYLPPTANTHQVFTPLIFPSCYPKPSTRTDGQHPPGIRCTRPSHMLCDLAIQVSQEVHTALLEPALGINFVSG